MGVCAVIPARYASTRLEGKTLADIAGRPMIQWVYHAVERARYVDDVIVATDDERVARAVEGFGGRVLLTSRDHHSGTDRVAEAARALDHQIIVNIQGDEPLIQPEAIDEAVRPLLDDGSIMMVTLKRRIDERGDLGNPNVVKVVTDRDGFALYFSRHPIPYLRDGGDKEAIPHMHYKHIGLYVYRREFLLRFSAMPPTPLEEAEKLEQLRALENGYRVRVVETTLDSVAVDTEEDLQRVRDIVAGLMRSGQIKHPSIDN
ncbi:MAG: 3-deoxy-manno-octulosonate cytidylyltransferase [Thermodesulfobacteriota bacterium]